jgi:hypothetical protein
MSVPHPLLTLPRSAKCNTLRVMDRLRLCNKSSAVYLLTMPAWRARIEACPAHR